MPRASRAGPRIQYQPLGHALRESAGAKNKKTLVRLLSPVHLASQKSPLVQGLVDSGDLYQPLAWTPHDAYQFLKDVPILEESGILVRLPDWWKKRPRPRVGVTIGEKKKGKFGVGAMLDFQVQRALGDVVLSDDEWRTLLAADDGLVLLRGQWVEVDHEKLQEAMEHWKRVEEQAADGLSFVEGMRLLAGAPADLGDDQANAEQDRQWSFVQAGQWLGDVLAKMRSPESLDRVKPGSGLTATLRKYQETGVDWLGFLSGLGLGACLADDMGLGKTIQVLGLLAAMNSGKASRPSLLVLPASLLANWKAEIAGSRRRCGSSSFIPRCRRRIKSPQVGPTAAGLAWRGPCGHDLWHVAPSGVAPGTRVAVGDPRRSPGHQEPGRPADEGRQATQGRRADRPDRHPGGEPPGGPLVAVRFPLSRPAGLRKPNSRTSSRRSIVGSRTATPRCETWSSPTSSAG